MKTRHFALPAALLTAALALAGCGGAAQSQPAGPTPAGTFPMEHSGHAVPMDASKGSPIPSPSQSAFNAADAMFAQMMIPHHEQAIEMSGTVLAKPGLDPRVAKLAEEIRAAQAPEIATQSGWLEAWGQPRAMPAGAGRGMDGMDGMMTADDLAKLKAASAPEAARLFLTQMIAHHEGAVSMAQTEQEGGSNPEAVAMARSIVDSQTAEIDGMKTLLGQL
ncbi:DUF305 domain-containing protein [Sinomonas cyclohexanicum]|uniref:DUF305 domain-containing protein n=1 Tax=Sinomonas cyclohexanicum TaxID=322009 RepID=A0ABN6FM33_SINCY|nr:DUF305 domain-containing protein [Corynebacterium cyclohexanicum]BCT77879.1 DUF305 domain-containing protein [Corynebacterium cyclohexanicum]